MNRQLVAIIPALNPTNQLIDYTKQLLQSDFPAVVIVNDGSEPNRRHIFAQLNEIDGVTVLQHDVNFGKGRALKTAFHYCLSHFPDKLGVVTADADGQHAIDDVCNVSSHFAQHPTRLVLGVRDFSKEDVPKKSYLGNVICTNLFYFLFGKKLPDTQTGLRAIPMKLLRDLVSLKGDRYEYEMNMLIYAIKRNVPIDEVTIKTIYYNNNEATYFKAIRDSFEILKKLAIGFFHFSSQFKNESQIGDYK